MADLIDTHVHLDFEQFAGEEAAVVARAGKAGVTRLINVGTTLERSRSATALAERFPNVWAAAGIHPHDAGDVTPDNATELHRLAEHPRVVAIGECGFDSHYADGPDPAAQAAAFERQVAIAAAVGKPLIVHSRDAEDLTVEALQKACQVLPERPGVVHCFTGSGEFAEKVLTLGFFISFTAPVTYPGNDALRKVVKAVPLDRIMVETDAPFLPPADRRGERNEPAFVVETARKIAEIKGLSFDEVAAATTANAERLFGLGS
ncbi:MAG: TatD family hydrolase [bacterium]|nr:TatD family hydrolase [bacterium]